MGIRLETRVYHRPFRQPLKTAHGAWAWREGLLIRLSHASGQVSYGEIAPIPWFSGETVAIAEAFCLAHGRLDSLESLNIPDHLPATQFGIESALEAGGKGVAELRYEFAPQPPILGEPDFLKSPRIGGFRGRDNWQLKQFHPSIQQRRKKPALPPSFSPASICGLLPAGERALTAWPPLYGQGTRTFKWKIGVYSLAQEIAWLEQLMEAMPAGSCLRLDANGGLTPAMAEQWLARCDRLRSPASTDILSPPCTVEYLEQPLPPAQFEEMIRLHQGFQTPIALDESVATLAQLETCQDQGWNGIYVVKPAIAGSPSRLRAFCRQYAPRLVFSSAFETPVGRQAALALAADCYQLTQPHRPSPALGFGTLGWFDDDWDTLTPDQLWNRL